MFDTAVLHALVADAEGQTMSLSRLDELVARISNYYHSKGYPLARAIVPAQSIVSGDTGYMGTAELRHDLGMIWNGGLQAIAFIDGAYVTINKSPWAAGVNSATLRGAGVGINWVASQQWSAKVSVAAPLGARPALAASTASARVWGQIGYGF
ncbi:POTRA domain-containing protein [Glaciimonas sp. PCH181]|uniref:POTRA domain-containing protein n=1 Tax=Glaciimonas sp. PCH181 TaxID=2133943 RepID=UPI000D383398|nr:POTRA domain-containing protein [Glaciimonas sp. PCH181]PUA19125.1 hypothetical protein C7W93_04300 [Glaciimonas sp. PCH181]